VDIRGLVQSIAGQVIAEVNERLQAERQAFDQRLQQERQKVAETVTQVVQQQQGQVVEAVINHFEQRIAAQQEQPEVAAPNPNGATGSAAQYLPLLANLLQPKQPDWKSAMEMFQGLMNIFGGGVGFASNIFSTAVKGGASAENAADALKNQAGAIANIFKPPGGQ
jgi:3-hydroxy-3-methylglutaryl CoA synthase